MPASATQFHQVSEESELQNALASAHATKSTTETGTSRRSEISRRRASSIPSPSTHRPTMIVTYETSPAVRSIAKEEKTAPRAVRV